jgi:hypothetical protein
MLLQKGTWDAHGFAKRTSLNPCFVARPKAADIRKRPWPHVLRVDYYYTYVSYEHKHSSRFFAKKFWPEARRRKGRRGPKRTRPKRTRPNRTRPKGFKGPKDPKRRLRHGDSTERYWNPLEREAIATGKRSVRSVSAWTSIVPFVASVPWALRPRPLSYRARSACATPAGGLPADRMKSNK